MPKGVYRSPEAFRTALEQRIRRAVGGGNVSRFRQMLVFERFLARVFHHYGQRATLKGGMVLELRLKRARTTRDVDLRLVGSEQEDVTAALRTLGAAVLGDWLSFEVQPDPHLPRIKGPGMKLDGFRFRAVARLAGKQYGEPFGVDIAFADVVTAPAEVTAGSAFLDFAGVARPEFRIYPCTTHIAEKLHAYTMPRPTPNTRVKDLPDLALLATIGPLLAAEVRDAIAATFAFRTEPGVPAFLPEPPAFWARPYERMATLDELPWKTLHDVHRAAAAFLDPILRGDDGVWDVDGWFWR